jgi:hypothetical protein
VTIDWAPLGSFVVFFPRPLGSFVVFSRPTVGSFVTSAGAGMPVGLPVLGQVLTMARISQIETAAGSRREARGSKGGLIVREDVADWTASLGDVERSAVGHGSGPIESRNAR